jgi:hypothetical protein
MHWLKTAEYCSLFSTVVGTAIAAVTQQFAYAVTPMTLTLCLGMRQQHQQQKTIDRLQYQVATLHHQFELIALPSPNEIKTLEDTLSIVSGDLSSLPKNRRHPVGWEREMKAIERLERLEFILYRLEEAEALSVTRNDILSLEGKISALTQEYHLLLDKIALEHNFHYADLKALLVKYVEQIADGALSLQGEELTRIKEELSKIKAKLKS